jgi:apolipoprotein N-acyltransferase
MSAPEFTRTAVNYRVPGFQGSTPYVRWGNYAVLAIAVVSIVVAFVIHGVRGRN